MAMPSLEPHTGMVTMSQVLSGTHMLSDDSADPWEVPLLLPASAHQHRQQGSQEEVEADGEEGQPPDMHGKYFKDEGRSSR